MKLAEKLIEAAKKKKADPQFRKMVFDSVRRHKEEEEKEKQKKHWHWLSNW